MEKLVMIILQNTEKNKRKAASKNISSPHKIFQYMTQKLIILGDCCAPENLTGLRLKIFEQT